MHTKMATLHSIKAKRDPDISKEFFKKHTTCAEVSRKLYTINSKSKTKTIGTVTRCYNRWREKEYLDDGRVSRKKGTITGYRLNLKPFFKYANQKIKEFREEKELGLMNKLKNAKDKNLKKILKELLKGVKEKEFSSVEKEFLEYIFELPNVRKMACQRSNLFDGILNVLDKIFFYEQITRKTLVINIAKAFFTENKKYLKKYKDSYEQHEEFWRVIIKFLDKLMNKIREVSNFNTGEYWDLLFKTKISKYNSIPSSILDNYNAKEKQKLLKRFEIVFYENRKPTNDEMIETSPK